MEQLDDEALTIERELSEMKLKLGLEEEALDAPDENKDRKMIASVCLVSRSEKEVKLLVRYGEYQSLLVRI